VSDQGKAARLEREEGGLAVLTLDSPPLNLFDRRMIDDFQAAVAELAAEPRAAPSPAASTSTSSTA
jgi:enoyl-CoA hydratase/carnithine racemase